jgi:hypothetical protein
MKIKCFKFPCDVCNQVSTIQVFFKANGEVSYGRAGHYQKLNEDKKPVFEYHQQSKEYLMEKLKYVLPMIDQQVDQNQNNDDQKLKELSPVSKSTINPEGRSSSLVRTLALRAKGRRFESGSAHHKQAFLLVKSKLFTELLVEKCVIRCFKWFSNVLLKLKPSSLDFSTNLCQDKSWEIAGKDSGKEPV